jgi:hypothetical protein
VTRVHPETHPLCVPCSHSTCGLWKRLEAYVMDQVVKRLRVETGGGWSICLLAPVSCWADFLLAACFLDVCHVR